MQWAGGRPRDLLSRVASRDSFGYSVAVRDVPYSVEDLIDASAEVVNSGSGILAAWPDAAGRGVVVEVDRKVDGTRRDVVDTSIIGDRVPVVEVRSAVQAEGGPAAGRQSDEGAVAAGARDLAWKGGGWELCTTGIPATSMGWSDS